MAVNGKVKRIDLDDLIQEFMKWQKVSLKIFVLVQSCPHFYSTLFSVVIEELSFNLVTVIFQLL